MKFLWHDEGFWGKRIVAGIIALILCLALVGLSELFLVLLTPRTYYVWSPNLRAMFSPDSQVVTGIHGEKQFSINSEGIRGDEFSREQQYRILANRWEHNGMFVSR
jgi:hypothetical protein